MTLERHNNKKLSIYLFERLVSRLTSQRVNSFVLEKPKKNTISTNNCLVLSLALSLLDKFSTPMHFRRPFSKEWNGIDDRFEKSWVVGLVRLCLMEQGSPKIMVCSKVYLCLCYLSLKYLKG